MADPSLGAFRAVAGSLLSFVVASCSVLGPLAGEEDPSAPILSTIRVVTGAGAPLSGVDVRMQVFDDENAQFGQGGAIIDRTFRTGPDGTFDIRLEPRPEHRAFARNHAGTVTFGFFAILGDRYFPWFQRRALGSEAWEGEVFAMDINPGDPDYWFPIPDKGIPTPAAT